MASPVALKRLTREYMAIQDSPPDYITAKPLESNILEWHYVIQGPPDTSYTGGEYHGKLVFPKEYPFKPPAIYMFTPSGRFATNTSLCLTMSEFHPNLWNPAWSVATILNGLLSFMCSEESTSGSVIATKAQRRALALSSWNYNRSKSLFCEIFSELCDEEHLQKAADKKSLLQAVKRASSRSSSSNDSSTSSVFGSARPWKILAIILILCFLASRFVPVS
ncbi:MAG: ubiquitin-conjugating enzyme/RWD-like protein [Piptocephalis tieghemiana]|nr:MAG: ubiquitin-conjugating enzyme/RWD-like protein [Piptocephalis tieghemiana]